VPVTPVAKGKPVLDPVPPFATGKIPVTPVVKGKPVQLVSVPEVGVPKIGVTKVGEVANALAPLPVEVVTPVPPLAADNVPVTPVVKGRPVQLVSVPEVGIPKAGVTKEGLICNTAEPVPEADEDPVPPFTTGKMPET
jgi:hypothetical protein